MRCLQDPDTQELRSSGRQCIGIARISKLYGENEESHSKWGRVDLHQEHVQST